MDNQHPEQASEADGASSQASGLRAPKRPHAEDSDGPSDSATESYSESDDESGSEDEIGGITREELEQICRETVDKVTKAFVDERLPGIIEESTGMAYATATNEANLSSVADSNRGTQPTSFRHRQIHGGPAAQSTAGPVIPWRQSQGELRMPGSSDRRTGFPSFAHDTPSASAGSDGVTANPAWSRRMVGLTADAHASETGTTVDQTPEGTRNRPAYPPDHMTVRSTQQSATMSRGPSLSVPGASTVSTASTSPSRAYGKRRKIDGDTTASDAE
ncbi:hypothetical protein IAU59_004860 [Kwoniella sp. CBS 9459]